MLSERIDGLADAVRSLQHALADRLEDHRVQLISLRGRVARLDSMDELAAKFDRKGEELSHALAARSGQQDELQQQLAGLTRDVRSLRRRMTVTAKSHAAGLTENQIEAVAQAILSALQQKSARSSGVKRRSPGRTSRK
jgi:predicted  nucleic acid-binding Zn-ribbon protein